jgi:hypothetical protein
MPTVGVSLSTSVRNSNLLEASFQYYWDKTLAKNSKQDIPFSGHVC